MSTLNYIDENRNINKFGIIPQNVISDVLELKAKGYSLLWENPSPTSSFASQQITLSSNDYDLLLVIARVSVTYSNAYSVSVIIPKGEGIFLNMVETTGSGSNISIISRTIQPTSDNTLYVNVGQKQTQGSVRSTDNNYLVPIKVYGIRI